MTETTKFGYYGKITTHPGKRDEMVALLMEGADALQGFEDCQLYVVNVAEDESDTIWVTEVWTNEAAHAASLQLEAVKAAIQRARPLIVGGAGTKLRVLGGKGL